MGKLLLIFLLLTSNIFASQVTLNWSDASDASAFIVERSTDGVNFNNIGNTSNLSYVDSDLPPNTTYYYGIVAANSAGYSPMSNIVSIITAPDIIIPIPYAPNISANTSSQIIYQTISVFTNFSARGFVNNNSYIVGFTIEGPNNKNVLIRCAGPSLIQFGIITCLPDPKIALYSENNLMDSNNGWNNSANLETLFKEVGAFNFTTSKDCALNEKLAPGQYTVIVNSVSNKSGIVLVEIYQY